jgi:PhnB protein
MQISSYLNFKDQCAAAFNFYARVLGGEAMFIRAADTPVAQQMPPDRQNFIMHARLAIGDQVILGSDTPPEHYRLPQGFSVSINVDEPDEAERIHKALSEGGTITMPVQETFWAERFGMLVDRFGTHWMINCEKPQP